MNDPEIIEKLDEIKQEFPRIKNEVFGVKDAIKWIYRVPVCLLIGGVIG